MLLQKLKLSHMILLSKLRTAVQIIFEIRSLIKRYANVLTQNIQPSCIRTIYKDHLKTTKNPCEFTDKENNSQLIFNFSYISLLIINSLNTHCFQYAH